MRKALVALLLLMAVPMAASATDQATCVATVAGIDQASDHIKKLQEEWSSTTEVGDVDLSQTYSGPELVAMSDVTAAHKSFLEALNAYASRIAIAKATIAACAAG